MCLTSNPCLWLKYKSSIHNTAFSCEKVISFESEEKYAEIKHCLKQLKQSKLALNKYVGGF